MNGIELVRKAFDNPLMGEDEADHILWGTTGFPCFYTGSNPARCFYYQLRHAKRALDRGFTVDDIYCGNDTNNPKGIE